MQFILIGYYFVDLHSIVVSVWAEKWLDARNLVRNADEDLVTVIIILPTT